MLQPSCEQALLVVSHHVVALCVRLLQTQSQYKHMSLAHACAQVCSHIKGKHVFIIQNTCTCNCSHLQHTSHQHTRSHSHACTSAFTCTYNLTNPQMLCLHICTHVQTDMLMQMHTWPLSESAQTSVSRLVNHCSLL